MIDGVRTSVSRAPGGRIRLWDQILTLFGYGSIRLLLGFH